MPRDRHPSDPVTLTARVERKAPQLSRFVVVAASLIEHWQLTSTTVVDATANGTSIGRRTLKPWDDARWFIEIPQRAIDDIGVDTGENVELMIRIASVELPDALTALLDSDPRAMSAWTALSDAQQRMLREHVLGGRSADTRVRRALRGLGLSAGEAST